ncbi:MAG TPA: hypothetical protein VGM54_10185 [Chthoniobacter sp.]|jgi:hypothetical protein
MSEISPVILDEILEEVQRNGSADVDMNLLVNAWFAGETERRLDEWTAKHNLHWQRDSARTGRLNGPLVRFSPGQHQHPST